MRSQRSTVTCISTHRHISKMYYNFSRKRHRRQHIVCISAYTCIFFVAWHQYRRSGNVLGTFLFPERNKFIRISVTQQGAWFPCERHAKMVSFWQPKRKHAWTLSPQQRASHQRRVCMPCEYSSCKNFSF